MHTVRRANVYWILGLSMFVAALGLPRSIFAQALLSFATQNLGGQEASHLVISEVQIAGVTAGDEFVELFNPTSASDKKDYLYLVMPIKQ